jgi:hypothetical protein
MFADGRNVRSLYSIRPTKVIPAQQCAPLKIEGSQLTGTPRETAGSVRSAHVAYFMPPDWGRIAQHLAPALERGVEGAVRLLVLVPDAPAALSLSRALAALPTGASRRIVAATSSARITRLLSTGAADAVVGPAAVITAGLGTSKLKLDQLATVALVSADELDADSDELAAVLSEVPKEAARLLTALVVTAGVDALIERYLPKVRRVIEDVVPAEGSAVAATVRYLTLSGDPADALPMVLDELDAPSAVVLAADAASADAARDVLRSVGYGDSALAQVSTDAVAANSALVVTLGVPAASVWQNAVDAQPAQIVALITPRDLPALRLLAGATEPRPLTDRSSVSKARSAEARRRAELRAELGDGIPSREVLALEPLLREHDGLEIAAAALRILERVRAEQTELVHAAELRVRTQMREAQKEKEREERDARPRSDGPRGFKPRGDGPREYKPRGDGPRDYKPRGDGPREYKPRGDGPREYKPRGEGRGDGPRPFKPRGEGRSDGPRPFKPRGEGRGEGRGDSPRGFPPRGDKPRCPRPPRGDR